MKLFEIAREYEEILDDLYDENGEVNQEALIRLEQNELDMQKKAIAIASYIKNMDAEREAIDSAKKAMIDREKRYKKRIDELEGYLLTNMQQRQINKITCPYFEIRLKKCPVSVDVIDATQLPPNYTRIKTEILPDKINIKNDMLNGVIVPGCVLKTNLRLEIK
jgi:Gp157 protein